ncbi:MAG: hypothetical protein HYY51_00450 [Candidatus Magasanikbacteria bacterium]|nr:hypothetical protein [Candidatus Magasanikbacteria bacterium]
MNYKRALCFGVFFYVFSFIVLALIQIVSGIPVFGFREYAVFWVLAIPLTLLLSKWYFRVDAPSLKKGFMLGILTLIVGFFLDLLVIGSISAYLGSNFKDLFLQFYADPKFYLSLLEILVLTSFAGFEFDATYTKRVP